MSFFSSLTSLVSFGSPASAVTQLVSNAIGEDADSLSQGRAAEEARAPVDTNRLMAETSKRSALYARSSALGTVSAPSAQITLPADGTLADEARTKALSNIKV